jgi:hypothetical protein
MIFEPSENDINSCLTLFILVHCFACNDEAKKHTIPLSKY